MSGRRRLSLELDSTADPISGEIGPLEGPAAPFSGYLELIAALEHLRDGKVSEDSSEKRGET